MSTISAARKTVDLVTQELQSQTLNSIVGGFSFAAAMSWMDLIRWFIAHRFVDYPHLGNRLSDHLPY